MAKGVAAGSSSLSLACLFMVIYSLTLVYGKKYANENVNFYIDARSVFLLNECFCSKLQYSP